MTKFHKFSDPNLLIECDDAGNALRIRTDASKAASVLANYSSLSARPTAASFGVGQCQIRRDLYVSDGEDWSLSSPAMPANLGVLGDSIGFLNFDLLTAANNAIASQEGFITHFNRIRGYRHIITSGQAVSGVTAQNVLQTELPALKALTMKPKVIFLAIGANDFFTYSYTASKVLVNVKSILNELAALDIRCVVMNGFPRSTWHAEYTSGKQAEFLSYIQQLPALVSRFSQHYLIDSYSIASSTGDITGSPVDGWTVDGIHPNQRYAAAIGELLHKSLPSSETLWDVGVLNASDMRAVSTVISSNIIAGSNLAGLTAGSTALPAGFAEAVKTNVTSAFLSEVKNDDFKQLRVTLTFSAAGSYLLEYSENGSYLSATDQWVGSGKMALSDNTNVIATQIRCKAEASVGNAQTAYGEYLHYPTASGAGVINHIGGFGDRLIATALAGPLAGATMSKAVVGWWVRTDAAGTVVMTISEPAIHKIPTIV